MSVAFDFNFVPQPTQDADLLRQLPFVVGLKEILMLRQIHALEHATVWILSQSHSSTSFDFLTHPPDNALLGGLSTEKGFYLYGDVNLIDLQRAARTALRKLTHGEDNLAIHPRCGTNVSVEMLLTASLAIGMHLLLPRGFIEQIIGFGIAATTAAQLAPDLGNLVQKYVTTAVPFNLEIENIAATSDEWGRKAHFVAVRWIE